MKKIGLVVLVFLWAAQEMHAQESKKITAAEYINTYKALAISEMMRTGIPASITLAQGLLESGTGNSPLAKQANNHFGIKCKTGWTGRTINVDDDDLQECFRAYDRAEDSYKDHSDYLSGSARYGFLFKLEPSDYKGWAYGLRQAGYATNPKYPELVITNIEKYSLYQYDIGNKKTGSVQMPTQNPSEPKTDIFNKPIKETATIKYNNIPAYEIRSGDTYSSIADNHGMMRWEIRKYNDLMPNEELKPKTIIYLKPKRRRAKQPYHTVKESEGMYYISQKEGIKQRLLYKWNRMEKGQEPKPGETLYMRKKRETPPQLKPEGTVMPRMGIMAENEGVQPLQKNNNTLHPEDFNRQHVQDTHTDVSVPSTNLDGNDPVGKYHLANDGETVYGLSKTYNVPFANLIEWNHISGPLHNGQKVYVTQPTNFQTKPKLPKDIDMTEVATADTNGVYIVKQGETLYGIARKFHVPVDTIIKINRLQSNNLYKGQGLVVQTKSNSTPQQQQTNIKDDPIEYHTVTSGETLYSIAKKYNVTIDDLVVHNGLQGNSISIGQKLAVKW